MTQFEDSLDKHPTRPRFALVRVAEAPRLLSSPSLTRFTLVVEISSISGNHPSCGVVLSPSYITLAVESLAISLLLVR